MPLFGERLRLCARRSHYASLVSFNEDGGSTQQRGATRRLLPVLTKPSLANSPVLKRSHELVSSSHPITEVPYYWDAMDTVAGQEVSFL
jgi:hypothetical protein